jgi:orotate phosphoribosyltransferase
MAEACDFADGVMIRRLGEKWNWRKPEQFCAGIKEATGQRISEPTIKRALRGDRMKEEIRQKIADSFKVPLCVVTVPRDSKTASYAFEDIMAGARQAARKAFKQPPADVVLTFPGASSIFAGCVLVTLRDPQRFLRIPVYTAIFKELDERGPFNGFRVATTTRFKVLVPEALFNGRHNRVVVIDDTTISGGTMDELRKLLESHFGKGNVKFASCICHRSLAFGNRTRPEIIGLPRLEKEEKFPMPWGIDSYRNEEGFPEKSARKARTTKTRS